MIEIKDDVITIDRKTFINLVQLRTAGGVIDMIAIMRKRLRQLSRYHNKFTQGRYQGYNIAVNELDGMQRMIIAGSGLMDELKEHKDEIIQFLAYQDETQDSPVIKVAEESKE